MSDQTELFTTKTLFKYQEKEKFLKEISKN